MDRLERRANKTKFHKEIRRKIIEGNKLWESIRQADDIELETPYKKGYNGYYVLQEHVLRSNIRERIQRLLNTFNKITFSKRKDFKYDHDCYLNFYKKGDPIIFKTKIIRVCDELPEYLEEFRKYLYVRRTTNNISRNYYEVGVRRDVIKRFFKERIRVNWVTKVKEINPIFISRERKLSNYLHNNGLYHISGYSNRSTGYKLSNLYTLRIKYGSHKYKKNYLLYNYEEIDENKSL